MSHVWLLVASLAGVAALPGVAWAQEPAPIVPAGVNIERVSLALAPAPHIPTGQGFVKEVEPNGTPGSATPLGGTNVVVLGNVFPTGDVDLYSFTGAAGDRVYAAVMTSFSADATFDSALQLIGTDGTTVLETDLDDGTFGTTSSSIAGAALPSAGTFYLRVTESNGIFQIRPYHLHVRTQSGAPTPEVEPNDGGQPLPPSGWISGSLSASSDVDRYTLSLNAGDTVYSSLDLDPTRDNTQWNGRLGLGSFGGFTLLADDLSTGSPTNPLSEAHFTTVAVATTYAVSVSTLGTFGDYTLSVAVIPAQAQTCTTYPSTDVPKVIPTGPGSVDSTLTIPGQPRIGDLNVSIELNHSRMEDLEVMLLSPAGNENGLFTDIGNATVGGPSIMNLTLDDEAGIPLGTYTVVEGLVNQPEPAFRLDWFHGEDAGGTWTLRLGDDTASNGGTLTAWSLRVCEPTPPCAPSPTVYYAQDFEAGDGGYVHSGAQDEWEWGTPNFPPAIVTCNSGTRCFKTDLDNTYNPNSAQDLLSVPISLAGVSGPIHLRWAMRYQLDAANRDQAFVEVRQAGGANPTWLWEWLGPNMTLSPPLPAIQETAGWGFYDADISAYAGQTIEVRFHLDSGPAIELAGLAIDDVRVDSCPVPVELTSFSLE